MSPTSCLCSTPHREPELYGLPFTGQAFNRLLRSAEGGIRTHTGLTPREFESRASASSATSALVAKTLDPCGNRPHVRASRALRSDLVPIKGINSVL